MSDILLAAIDPGTEESGYVLMRGHHICLAMMMCNAHLEHVFRECRGDFAESVDHLAIEIMAHGGHGHVTDTNEWRTQLWAGRFIGAFAHDHTQLTRSEIRGHLGCMRGGDAAVRQALIRRYAGKLNAPCLEDVAIGTEQSPGPLFGLRGHLWSALAVGVTWLDKYAQGDEEQKCKQ